jgi:hypothetical protein
MDPLRYVDLQLEVLNQLSRNNDRFLNSIPNDAQYSGMRQAAVQVRDQDRQSFARAEHNVRDALERERGHLQPGDDRRRQAIDERFRELDEYRRRFNGGG